MPKKKKTHIAKDTNCIGRGRVAILLDRSAPMLQLLLSGVLVLLKPLDDILDDIDVLADDLEGVVGQSSSWLAANFLVLSLLLRV